MHYKDVALCTDLDGTLFNSQRQISPENRLAIEAFIADGGSFGISTGRAASNALDLVPDIPINTWSVVLNGAAAYHHESGRIAHVSCLPKDTMESEIRWVLQALPEIQIMLCTDGPLLFLSDLDLIDHDFWTSHQPMSPVTVDEALKYTWLKVLFCAPRPILEKVKAHAEETRAAEAMYCVYTNEVYLEFLPREVNKGRCLASLRSMPELQGKTFIAIGDYTNDIELLQNADVSVAVGNALPTVKAVADHVICTNDEHAVAYLIRDLIPRL